MADTIIVVIFSGASPAFEAAKAMKDLTYPRSGLEPSAEALHRSSLMKP